MAAGEIVFCERNMSDELGGTTFERVQQQTVESSIKESVTMLNCQPISVPSQEPSTFPRPEDVFILPKLLRKSTAPATTNLITEHKVTGFDSTEQILKVHITVE
jgi:hypothetical protein